MAVYPIVERSDFGQHFSRLVTLNDLGIIIVGRSFGIFFPPRAIFTGSTIGTSLGRAATVAWLASGESRTIMPLHWKLWPASIISGTGGHPLWTLISAHLSLSVAPGRICDPNASRSEPKRREICGSGPTKPANTFVQREKREKGTGKIRLL